MRKNKQSIDIFNVIKQYFKDSKINTAEIIQGGVPFVATGVAVSRQNELEFARVLPFLNKYWQTLGVLDNVKKLKYLNYYGEYYDCSRTPFALLKGQDKTYDIEQLASELNERYNYDIKSQPIERVINGERQKVAELSLDWYANRDFENGFLSSFDKTIPILKNIEFIAACSCDNNDIKYYPIYPNGQLK